MAFIEHVFRDWDMDEWGFFEINDWGFLIEVVLNKRPARDADLKPILLVSIDFTITFPGWPDELQAADSCNTRFWHGHGDWTRNELAAACNITLRDERFNVHRHKICTYDMFKQWYTGKAETLERYNSRHSSAR